LNGSDTNTGGNISMPIEIVTLATTMSRITNGSLRAVFSYNNPAGGPVRAWQFRPVDFL